MEKTKFKFKNGEMVEDLLTGFSGMVVYQIDYLTGCNRYGVKPTKLDEKGQPLSDISFDEAMLERMDRVQTSNLVKIAEDKFKPFQYDTGDLVKDKISGFKGVVIGRVHKITGSNSYLVTPTDLDKEGNPKSHSMIDEAIIELLDANLFHKIETDMKEKTTKIKNNTDKNKGGPGEKLPMDMY